VTAPACAGCGRQVTLKSASPQGPICSACTARRHQGRCHSCNRHGQLVGRNSDGQPWCQRCHSAAAADQLAGSRRAAVLIAVSRVEPLLPAATVLHVIEEAAGVRCLGRLARHLQAHPDTLLTGPTSLPPVLDRFVRALITAGAQQITVIHPSCLDCGRTQRAQQRLADGVLCGTCHTRRAGKQMCAGCSLLRRPHSRDEAGDSRCGSCVQRARRDAEHSGLLEQLTAVLAQQARVDAATITGVLAVVASQRHQLRVLTELLTTHHLTEPGLPFVLARLVIALRAAGADLPAPPCASCQQPTGPEVSLHGQRVRCRDCAWRCPTCGKARRGDDPRPCRRYLVDPHQRRGSCTAASSRTGCSTRKHCADGAGSAPVAAAPTATAIAL